MPDDPLAGQPVPPERRADIDVLTDAFWTRSPDAADPGERVSFGTSGHRGSSLDTAFNEAHIAAIARAVVEYRAEHGIDGPMFVGKDTHALSGPALEVALPVLRENGVEVRIDDASPYTPTPVISHAILTANGTDGPKSDGLILTPSHNPPEDGGIKYNPPHGGPAGGEITGAIERRANELLESGVRAPSRDESDGRGQDENDGRGQDEGDGRGQDESDGRGQDGGKAGVSARGGASGASSHGGATGADGAEAADLRQAYIDELGRVLDMDAIAGSGVRIGVDPLGGSSIDYWEAIAERFGLNLEVVNPEVDPAFSFMRLDWDGKVRMDCSSPHAMAGLIELKDDYDVAIGLDPDADRHGIVTPGAGLLNPNHYLAVAVSYLFRNRPDWGDGLGVGKTLVSSSMIDRVTADLGRRLVEVPVGFKWFVDGLREGRIAFAGEESAGATFVRRDGSPWTTDKDGILLGLLAAEITAKTGRDPGEHYRQLEERFGAPVYERTDAPATSEQKAALKSLSPESVRADELAGERIEQRLTRAPGNDAPIGGLKVVTENGWFAARPSGTEDVYKIYAESFRGPDHLHRIQEEARSIVQAAFDAA